MATMLGSLLVSLGLESAQFSRGLNKATKETSTFTTSTANAFKAMAATIAASFGGAEVIRLVDTYSQMTSQLRLVTDGAANLAEIERQLFAASQANRVGLESTVGLYARIARATETMGVSQSQVLQVTDAINKALIVSGTTSKEAAGALLQLGQGLASGTLRGEELNSVMEQTPALARAIADGMGVPIGELRKLGEQGKLTSQEVFNALIKMSGDIQKEFAKMPPTVGQSLTVLQNAFLRFIGQLDQVTGASRAVSSALIVLSQSLPAIVSVVGGLTAAFIAHRAVLLAVTLATSNFGKAVAFNASVVMATSRSIGVMQGAQVAMAGATSIATGAFRSLTAAMIANPFGAIAVGVGVLTTAFMGLANAQAAARAETDNLIRSLDAAIKARGADVAAKRAEADVERMRAQSRLDQIAAEQARLKGPRGLGSGNRALELEAQELTWKVIELEGTVRLADRTLADMNRTAGQVAVPVAQAATAITGLGGAARAAGGQARAANDDFGDLYEALFPESITRRQQQSLAAIDRMQAKFQEMGVTRDEARRRALGLGDATVSSDLLGTGPINSDVQKALDDYVESVRDARVKTADATQGIAESFGQMADRTLQALDRLTGAIRGGGFLDILGGLLNFGLQLGGMGVFGKNIQASINKGVPGFANGTRFAPGGLAMVGERGPELVNLPRGSQVIPNRELASYGSGGGIAQIVPSPYFDVVVDGRIVRASPAIMQGGANVAQQQMGRAQSRRVPG